MKIYDAVLGVITNSPTYDWHLTNLRNYLHRATAVSPEHPVVITKFETHAKEVEIDEVTTTV